MALENQKATYTIEVVQTGAGAQAAVAGLKQVQNEAANAAVAARRLNTATVQNVTALGALSNNTRSVTTGMRLFQVAAQTVGFQVLPQLTFAASTAASTITQLRNAGVQSKAGFGVIAGGVAGVAALAFTAAEAWQTYNAEQQAAASNRDLADSLEMNADRLRMFAQIAREENAITIAEYRKMIEMLKRPTDAGNQAVRDALESLKQPSAQEQINDMFRQRRNIEAQAAATQPYSKKEQLLGLQQQLNQEQNTYNRLLDEGLITERERMNLSMEASTRYFEGIARANAQLSEWQQLSLNAAQSFSSGFANAFVSFVSGAQSAEDAFRNFAASFLRQIAEMIIQQIVFNALKAAGRSFGVFGGGGVSFAASGGMFPTYAANGLAGVQSVSRATYLPRFNVVAGEAGREMLTVLAKPRMMEVGGVQSVVGFAGAQRLAISNADQMERRGGAGVAEIHISMEPGLRAQIVNDSVKGAVVRVTNDMTRDTSLRKATQKAVK